MTLEVQRGPIMFSYPPVEIGFRAFCDPFQFDSITITPNFITPCSRVEWAGTLRDEQRFIVNINTQTVGDVAGRPNQVEVTLHNPDYAVRRWGGDSRLLGVSLFYRRVGTLTWVNVTALNFINTEGNYGYATQYWNVSTIPDGHYEIEARTSCTLAVVNAAIEGINGVRTAPIRGWMDRRGPQIFGRELHPTDELYSVGDDISATFDEEIDYEPPFSFTVIMKTIPTPAVGYITNRTTNQIPVVCEGRTIRMELPTNMSLDAMYGQRINITVRNVRDAIAGNVATAVTFWQVLLNRVDVYTAGAVIEGLNLFKTWTDSLSDSSSAEALNLTTAIVGELHNFTAVRCACISICSP